MRQLSEYIASGITGLMVIEKDARYARRLVLDSLSVLSGGLERPFLEWTMAKGWKAGGERVADLVDRSGQSVSAPTNMTRGADQSNFVPQNEIPAKVVETITNWFESVNTTDIHAFTKGVLVLHDMYALDAATPHMVRAVQEMMDALSNLQGTVIFLSPVELSSSHPLKSVLVVVPAAIDPNIRYEGFPQGFISHTQSQLKAEDIVAALQELTVSEAELVLRLTLLDRDKGEISTDDEYLERIKLIAADVRRSGGHNPARVLA